MGNNDDGPISSRLRPRKVQTAPPPSPSKETHQQKKPRGRTKLKNKANPKNRQPESLRQTRVHNREQQLNPERRTRINNREQTTNLWLAIDEIKNMLTTITNPPIIDLTGKRYKLKKDVSTVATVNLDDSGEEQEALANDVNPTSNQDASGSTTVNNNESGNLNPTTESDRVSETVDDGGGDNIDLVMEINGVSGNNHMAIESPNFFLKMPLVQER